MSDRIYLSSPHMSDEGYEMEYVKEAFDTNWIAPLGGNVNKFEEELAVKVGSKSAAALSSGTAAIHLALKAAGVSEGDIVFCPTLTFSATANPIIYQRSEEHTSELQSRGHLVCRLLLEKKKNNKNR